VELLRIIDGSTDRARAHIYAGGDPCMPVAMRDASLDRSSRRACGGDEHQHDIYCVFAQILKQNNITLSLDLDLAGCELYLSARIRIVQ
jgi:hypothetical protein